MGSLNLWSADIFEMAPRDNILNYDTTVDTGV